ncbi:unnamed protein product, partial [Brassica rapa subsp. narinosa]
DLFLWFPGKGISVDIPCSGDIYFDVRVVHKRYSMSLFETVRNCVAVGRRLSFVGITSVRDLNGVTVVNRKLHDTDTHTFHLRSDAPFFPQIALITLFEVKMMRESSAQV